MSPQVQLVRLRVRSGWTREGHSRILTLGFSILYMLFGAIPIVYEENRGWSPVSATLPFLSVLIGCFIAAGTLITFNFIHVDLIPILAAINITYSNTIFRRALEQSEDGRAQPEMRLPPMMIGSITFPVGFFIVGWTSDPKIHWFPSVLGFAFIGMSFLLIFQASLMGIYQKCHAHASISPAQAGLNYLIDSYTSKAASAVGQ